MCKTTTTATTATTAAATVLLYGKRMKEKWSIADAQTARQTKQQYKIQQMNNVRSLANRNKIHSEKAK